jgi:hypothetical protein
MTKNIYIGDIHGRAVWKDIVAAHPDATTITFIGDYFDSFDISPVAQLHNIGQIVEFKKDKDHLGKTKVNLLIGNHDHHYWPGVGGGGTSGYQQVHSFQFEQFFDINKAHFKMAALVGNALCTHAGVSPVFLKDWGWNEGDDIVTFLNDLFVYRPRVFQFQGRDPYGDDIYQTPIWIRPGALQRVNKQDTIIKDQYIQIVGHTQQQNIYVDGKSTGGKYYYIDALAQSQYLVEEEGEFKRDFIHLV